MSFYRGLLQKSEGDLRYFEENKACFIQASRLMRNIEASTFNYDLKMSLTPDQTLRNDYFQGVNAVVMTGEETTELWQSQLQAEANRLNLPIVYAPSGDLYAPYASPDMLITTMDERARKRKRA
ncbi:MAG: hypothetical protein HRT80_09685 [Henriciella sp.]|nr:hypothetical protein [Henriciella sp.]